MNDERNARVRETRSANSEAADDAGGKAEAVRTPQVRAGACPRSESHTATRVYRTLGEVRYCVCDDCGATWKKSGPPATPKVKEKERSTA